MSIKEERRDDALRHWNYTDELVAAQNQAEKYKKAWEAEKLLNKVYIEAARKTMTDVTEFEQQAYRLGFTLGVLVGLVFTALGVVVAEYFIW